MLPLFRTINPRNSFNFNQILTNFKLNPNNKDMEEIDSSDSKSSYSFTYNINADSSSPSPINSMEQYYIIPISKEHASNYTNTQEVQIFESLVHLKKTYWKGDYSNKTLIIHKDDVEVVKTKYDFSSKNKVVFVINKSLASKIKKNEYHLDNLQYDLAKSMGLEPQHIKVSYFVDTIKDDYEDEGNKKTGYTKVIFTKMVDKSQGFYHLPFKVSRKSLNIGRRSIKLATYNTTHGKQWLGGYKTSSGKYYVNAVTQTEPRRKECYLPPWESPPQLFSRCSQTHAAYKDIGINLPVDHATQMWRSDYYIPCDTDKIITPKFYKSFNTEIKHVKDNKENAAIVLQKYWRSYCKRKKNNFPHHYSKYDFCNKLKSGIYDLLNKDDVKKKQLANHLINNKDIELQDSFSKKAEQCASMGEKIAQIKKNWSKELVLSKNEKYFLEKSSAPFVKIDYEKESFTLIEMSNVEGWREFRELLLLYRKKDVTVDERLEILSLFKRMLDGSDYFEMKKDLIELIEREGILLSSGINPKYLKMLRKRFEEIILYCKENYETTSNWKKAAIKKVYRCKSCGKCKYGEEFPPSVIKKRTRHICTSCSYFHTAFENVDISLYDNILQAIRKDEFMLGCQNPYVSLLQPRDIYFIIQRLWGGGSIIDREFDVTKLHLPRWDNRIPWSPWNCILLTKTNAKKHAEIENVYDFYTNEIIDLIKHHNLVAVDALSGKLFYLEKKYNGEFHKTNLCVKEFGINLKTLMNSYSEIGDSFFCPPPPKKII